MRLEPHNGAVLRVDRSSPASAAKCGEFRRYGDQHAQRLRQICAYRESGLKLEDIRSLLDGPEQGASAVLRRRMLEIGAEIERLKAHQRAIGSLLHVQADFERTEMITKDKWISIMKGAGMTEEDMRRWHAEFERSRAGGARRVPPLPPHPGAGNSVDPRLEPKTATGTSH